MFLLYFALPLLVPTLYFAGVFTKRKTRALISKNKTKKLNNEIAAKREAEHEEEQKERQFMISSAVERMVREDNLLADVTDEVRVEAAEHNRENDEEAIQREIAFEMRVRGVYGYAEGMTKSIFDFLPDPFETARSGATMSADSRDFYTLNAQDMRFIQDEYKAQSEAAKSKNFGGTQIKNEMKVLDELRADNVRSTIHLNAARRETRGTHMSDAERELEALVAPSAKSLTEAE